MPEHIVHKGITNRSMVNRFITWNCMLRIFIFFTSVAISLSLHAQPTLKLWYTQPAAKWVEALPLVNGKLGAMVFGGANEELLQLNESNLWSGGPVKTNVNPEAKNVLPQIRKALLEEKDYTKANELTKKMQGLYSQSYLPMGDVIIRQLANGNPAEYYRDLNIGEATATTRFTADGVQYIREMFISAPDNVMVIHLTANRKGALTLDISARTVLRYQLSAHGSNEIRVTGKAPVHVDPSYYNPRDREHVV